MQQLKIPIQSITARDNLSINSYLQDISKENMITPEEEVELARRIREGDQEAKERLINANLRFVVSVAKQYQNQGLPLPDLIGEGNVGLIKAAEKFDETKGFKFISYAVWWIRQAIMQALANKSQLIRLPLNKVGDLTRIKKAQSRFEQENGRPASMAELAEILEMDVEKISELLRVSGKHVSMDAPFSDDDEGSLIDVLENENSPLADTEVNKESLKKEMDRILGSLNERERLILQLSFGMGGTEELTMDEIGEKMGISRERVRQIKEAALKKLKKNSSNFLRSYL